MEELAGIVYVFDVNLRNSFNNMKAWFTWLFTALANLAPIYRRQHMSVGVDADRLMGSHGLSEEGLTQK
jgi:hypothetical protein